MATESIETIQEMELQVVKQTVLQNTIAMTTSEHGASGNEDGKSYSLRVDSATPFLTKLGNDPRLELPSSRDLERLPPLNFRPPLLQNWALCISFIFNGAILAVLVVLIRLETFKIQYSWSYFVATVLPVVLGTMTSSLLDGTIDSLSRIRPFMMCAVDGPEPRRHSTKAKEHFSGNTSLFSCARIRQEGRGLSVRDLSKIRYNSASWVVNPFYLWFFTSLSLFLFGGYTSTLALRYIRGEGFLVTFNSTIGALVFSFISTGLSTFYNDYWAEVRVFAAATEPFVHLNMKNEDHERERSGLGVKHRPNAGDTLLLNYKYPPSVVIIHSALKRRHWKVARTAAVALLQRGLPILVGSSFVISYGEDNGANVEISIPFFVAIIAWMFVYILLIPYEVRESGYDRHLPRELESIGDLLSWIYSSSLLQGGDGGSGGQVDGEKAAHPGNDPLDIKFELHGLEPQPGTQRDWGVEVERWHMEARLLLTKTRLCFGLSNIRGTNEYTIGICNSEDLIDVLQPPASSACLSRKRRKGPRQDTEGRLEYSIAGTQDFKVIG
ncbi:Fc.00g012970.m01.CDS01 [Cosmosporella sp. VM-42]